MDITNVYKDYYKYIYNYALKLSCHPEDALDITQDTFLKAMKKLDTLDNEKALSKWLRTICFHEFISRTRKDKVKYIVEYDDFEKLCSEGTMLTDVIVMPEDEVIVDEEIKSMQNGCFLAMVRKLSLNQRITFSLVDMFGLNIDYVSMVLGISKGACKGLLYRARMNIDSFFSDHCSILNENNPCKCKAWINFSVNRENLHKQSKKLLNKLDFEAKNYKYNEEVRKKISYLYSNMPQQKPSFEWYQKVLKIISQNK